MSFFRPKWTQNGEELPDPTPLAASVPITPQKTIHEKVLDVLRSERWNEMMRAQGMETFEEANDFEVGDEDDLPPSMYEQSDDGHFYAARQGEIAGRMVEDPEMNAKQRDIMAKLDAHFNKPKEKKDDKPVS